MTNDTEIPQDTEIKKLVIDDAYKKRALDQVKAMVKGNRCDPESVKLEKFEGEILHFQAENMLTILKKVTKKKVAGRIEGSVVVSNDAAAKAAMNKAYAGLSKDKDMERKIRKVVLNRNDKGFAVDNNIIDLPFWKKEFVIFEPCQTCQTTGSIKCLPCSGKGIDQCPRCDGAGIEYCGHCNGSHMSTDSNGSQISCPNCYGSGQVACYTCNKSGQVHCKTCRSKGATTCPNCQGKAWSSDIRILEIEARTAFDYPKDKLPDRVVAMIEKYGVKIKEHADIKISQAEISSVNAERAEKAKEYSDASKNKNYRIPIIYEVFLPYGHIEYNINGKSYYTFLFGTQEKLVHVSPFLDDLIKKGIRKLHDAAESRGDVIDNIKQAAKYRTIKEGIFYTAMHSRSKARALLKKSNRLGLSDDAINDIIGKTDIALKKITNKPRNIGLALSGVFNLVFASAYLLSPARGMALSYISNSNLHIVFDAMVVALAIYIGFIIIQTKATSAIKNIMNVIGIKKVVTYKLGNKIYWNIGGSIIIFALMVEVTRYLNIDNIPAWYLW